MSGPVLLVLGLAAALAFAVVAKRFALPYPIVFVLAGTVLALIPGTPRIVIDPNWIFLAVLPPLLFSAGWTTDWRLFRANLRAILQLAIGLVIVTTVAVALVATHVVPGMGLAAAFVLGAIVSPPDAVAGGATFERFHVPRRIVAIVEGEGLINDATALVIYGYAVAAATNGSFTLRGAAVSFVVVAAGGVLAGIAVAWCVGKLERLLRRWELSDSLIDNLMFLGVPYAAYLGAQAVHVSGVLATVVAGITLSRRSHLLMTPETRLLALNVWNLWIYVLNAYVFLAIGLQLRTVAGALRDPLALVGPALLLSVLLIVVRLVWVYPTAFLARLIPIVARNDPLPPWTSLTVIGWTGMRGIVSLAAALALPYRDANGAPFPERNAIVFVTFVAIFVTLVGQGLTLGPLLKLLHVREDGDGEEREIAVRVAALRSGLHCIERLRDDAADDAQRRVLERLRSEYTDRIEHLEAHATGPGGAEDATSAFDHRVQTAAVAAERREILRLRDEGRIPDEIYRRIQYDLDLAESRLY
ncbi:MAG TPA: Na+/H+ antiporter [Candidatus Baltobacteraceae bacterium]|nr:Na+/H+ antiporter [Candidatus Baltobacteraceae bacterium]